MSGDPHFPRAQIRRALETAPLAPGQRRGTQGRRLGDRRLDRIVHDPTFGVRGSGKGRPFDVEGEIAPGWELLQYDCPRCGRSPILDVHQVKSVHYEAVGRRERRMQLGAQLLWWEEV